MNSGAVTIMLAGGGSGGHLMPGLAIAERIAERDSGARCLFLCSDRALDATILRTAAAEFHALPAQPLAWRPFPSALQRFVRGWGATRRTTAGLIERELSAGRRVRMVSLGGFVAAPAVTEARARGLRTAMVNLDAVPGKANRLIARRIETLVTAVPTRAGGKRFAAARCIGMPIRRSALARADAQECRARFGLDPAAPVLLILGASQGAGTFNRLMLGLLERVQARSVLARWQVLHLAGPRAEANENAAALTEAYARAGVRAKALDFCDAMGDAWGAADLALSRAGASSVAEAEANAVPTLFAPYPWHRDQHQRFNALPLVEAGKAWLTTDHVAASANLEGMGAELVGLLNDEAARRTARSLLKTHPPGDAAGIVADLLLQADLTGR